MCGLIVYTQFSTAATRGQLTLLTSCCVPLLPLVAPFNPLPKQQPGDPKPHIRSSWLETPAHPTLNKIQTPYCDAKGPYRAAWSQLLAFPPLLPSAPATPAFLHVPQTCQACTCLRTYPLPEMLLPQLFACLTPGPACCGLGSRSLPGV